MMEPIEANYVPDGDDWTITIVGRGKTLTATAPGLIAARDRADQLVEELAGNEKNRTVVHRLDGDALKFTTAYLNARLAKPEEPATEAKPPAAEAPAAQAEPAKTAKPTEDEPAQAATSS
ncbi:hypothetical protein [Kibdelosporangium aridum]|uniref:hypothetical protein n=1 Tax=Kibdelosporangium aridum TaxID=2030 RepID=UPI000568A134|nr:hypothetical protein [Kibdelosporangium aridum]